MTKNHSPEVSAILDGLSGSLAIFEGFLRAVPPAVLDRKRGQGFWSLHEHAAHLAEVQPMILARLRRILAEDMAEFVPFIPGKDETAEQPPLPPIKYIVREFTTVRAQQLDLLRNADEAAWAKSAIHPEYDQYGLYILARHILMHDHWHMYRMEELWLTKDEYLTKLEG